MEINDAMIERAAKAACDYPRMWDEAPEDGWKEYWRARARKILVAASGMEARRAETPQSGSVHDSPVAESETPKHPHDQNTRESSDE